MGAADLPLSRRVDVTGIPARGLDERVEADAAECQALAAAHDLQAVQGFTAEVTVERWRGEGVTVRGHVSARIVQTCVVSLEPVEQAIEEDFTVRLVPETSRLAAAPRDGAVEVAPIGEDPPDTFAGRSIDIGAIAVEHFALGIDPYPRAPGAALGEEAASGPAPDSPFGILADLARRRGDTE